MRANRIVQAFYLALLFAPLRAAATEHQEARQVFSEATNAYSNARFELALVQFKKAHQLRPSYKILFNIAQTHLELGQLGQALTVFEQYLKEGGADISDKRRHAVQQEIDNIRPKVGALHVQGRLGWELQVNQTHRGFLPMDMPLRLKGGFHEVDIRVDGTTHHSEVLEIIPGKTRIQRYVDSDEVAGHGPPAPSVEWIDMEDYSAGDMLPIKRKRPAIEVAPYPVLGTALLTGTIGTIMAIRTAALNTQLMDSCTNGSCSSIHATKIDSMKQTALVADIMFISTAILTGTAVTLIVLKRRQRDSFAARTAKGHL